MSVFPARRALSGSDRRILVAVIFGVWTLAAGATLLELGRLPCGVPRQYATDAAWTAEGWRAEHWLPDRGAATSRVAEHLIERGPLPGLVETVWLGAASAEWAPRLRARGWTVAVVAAGVNRPAWVPGAEPAVRLASAEVDWAAPHDVAGLEEPGASPLDTLVFRAVAAGSRVPLQVPAGCGV